MRKLLLTICILVNLNSEAQFLLPLQHDTALINQEIICHGNADYSFSSVRNDVGKKLIYGGYIDDAMKGFSFDKHKGINRLGIEAGAEIEYRNYQVNVLKKQRGILLKMGYGNFGSMLYSKDLFGLIFYGNDQYLGSTADFSGSRFRFMSFQKIGFGFIDKKSKSNISLNFYSISRFLAGNIYEGQLFQSAENDSINLLLSGEMNVSKSYPFIKGIGIGIDFDYRFPFEIKENSLAYFQITGRNLGLSYLPSSVTQYAVDSNYVYEGFTFNELFGNVSDFSNGTNILDTLNIAKSDAGGIVLLPGFIQVGKIIDETNKSRFQSFFGMRMYTSLAYSPFLFAGAQWRISDAYRMGVHASYGGYTGIRIGWYSSILIKKFSIGIGTEDVIGTVSNFGRGQSLQLRLRCGL